ncbi:MAG: regulatory protein LacI:Periplasmic binding protein/LacI transcriptional regulator [Capsulimonas sp.]|jgi:GntR family transcriptional regulator of arabinose operon|nr:regulatory protein LacI:Periplasmic binding protein/LacI transcriptional regulator [Capsulimonas sp.]
MSTNSLLLHPSSIQYRVIESLRERIQSGRYAAGEWLPSERELTEDFQVHRKIIRTAIVQMVSEGLLTREPNCRPIVKAPPLQGAVSGAISSSQLAASRLVALSMWHGGGESGSPQQRIFWGLNQALGQGGYHGVFLDLGDSIGTRKENAEREALHLQYALDQGFGGIIFNAYAYQDNHGLIQKVARQMPTVLIDRVLVGVEADFAGLQNRQAMYDATKYLIDQGHRRIAYVTKSESINPVQDRLQGYLSAMYDAFDRTAGEMVISTPFSDSYSWIVFDAIFRLSPEERPTAVLCVNDLDAVRVAERLEKLGFSVPEDVSLIGFDNIVRSLPSGVGLTTIAQPFEEIGAAAAKLFFRRLKDHSAPQSHMEIPATLVVRESTRSIKNEAN